MRVFLGITGASGAPYAARLLEALADAGCEVGLCASGAGDRGARDRALRRRALARDERCSSASTAGAASVTVYDAERLQRALRVAARRRSTPTSICPCSTGRSARSPSGGWRT